MTNTIKLLFLAILTAFALWRTRSHDDARHGDTLLRPFCVACVEKSEIKKRAFGLFFYGDKEAGRSQRSEVAKSLG